MINRSKGGQAKFVTVGIGMVDLVPKPALGHSTCTMHNGG